MVMARTEDDERPLGRDAEVAAQAELTKLYASHGRDVLAYALRRTASAEDAADVVADTFLVAWRRLENVPPEPDARLWLYGVARRTLANQRRGAERRGRLAERLRDEASAMLESVTPYEERERILTALAALAPDDRELLILVGWEGLSPGEAARVLEISGVAARARLHRARRRLAKALEERAGEASQQIAGPQLEAPR